MVVGNEGQKQLPMMVFGTEQLAPPWKAVSLLAIKYNS